MSMGNGMIDQDLYTAICQAKIKNSIFLTSLILLKDPDKNIDVLQHTFIAACSYIGSFISVHNIKLWLNVVQNLAEFIENDQIIIKDVYVLISKMCLLCDIYIKNPTIKAGTINIKILREKIIDMFNNEKFKLSSSGMSKFEGIIPPTESPSYALSQQIITGYVHIFKQLAEVSSDDKDKISDIANKLRNSFDYVIRKKYTFETKFYESDSDAVWFLWGIISLLFTHSELDILYELFSFGYNKKTKANRIGFLWGASVVMVYLTKKDVARHWNQAALHVLQKIEEVSLILYNDIRKQLIQSGEIQSCVQNKSINGIDYIFDYKPNIVESASNTNGHQQTLSQTPSEDETKHIRCKNKYMT